jgi:CRP-like cAMP-binding protein
MAHSPSRADPGRARLLESLLRGRSAALGKEDLASLSAIVRPEHLERGASFIREGEDSTRLALVVKGLFRSYYIDDEGRDYTKLFLPEGSILLSYYAHLAGRPSAYFIEALEDSELLVADIADFERLTESSRGLLLLYKGFADSTLVEKEGHRLSLISEKGMKRYLRFRRERPGLEARLKQCDLASYLGLTPVSLSRLRRRLGLNKG